MGRMTTLTTLTVEARQAQQQAQRREHHQRRRLDPEKLAQKKERDRLWQRERYRQKKLMTCDPLTLLATTATQAQSLEGIGDDDDDGCGGGELAGEICALMSVPEHTEVEMESLEDEGTLIQLHGNGKGFNLIGIHTNSRNPC